VSDADTGIMSWIEGMQYNGQAITTFDDAVSWAHTYTDEADPLQDVCLNCHGDNSEFVDATNRTWLRHAMDGRVSRSAMDKVEIKLLGEVSGTGTQPNGPTCRACHDTQSPDNSGQLSCDNPTWKQHLIEGRVAESVWEDVSISKDGTTCGW
jgi:hypothetical protein